MGAPVRTSCGHPRFFSAPLIEWPTTYPCSIYRLGLDEETFRRRYRHQLHRATPKLLAELRELHEGYGDVALLCYEDVSKTWCHRSMLSRWITERTGLEVPEVG
jgi:hypothetical protein